MLSVEQGLSKESVVAFSFSLQLPLDHRLIFI